MFEAPYFELSRDGNDFLRTLHTNLDPLWRPFASEMGIEKGERVASHRLYMSLFRGNATIVIDSNSLRATFLNVGKDDLKTAIGVLKACLDTTLTFVLHHTIGGESFRVEGSLEMVEGKAARDRILRGIGPPAENLERAETRMRKHARTSKITPIYKVSFEEMETGWFGVGEIAPNYNDETALYASVMSSTNAEKTRDNLRAGSSGEGMVREHLEGLQMRTGGIMAAIIEAADLKPVPKS